MATIHHPVLDVTREVPERTVPIWERSGWQAVEPSTESPAPADETPAEGDPETPDPEEG